MRLDRVLIAGISTRAAGPSADTCYQLEVQPHISRGSASEVPFRVLGDDTMLTHQNVCCVELELGSSTPQMDTLPMYRRALGNQILVNCILFSKLCSTFKHGIMLIIMH